MNTYLGKRGNAGFNLVETLVALVVLSVGMLGIVALYVTSMRANDSAVSRTAAVYLAADMADKIRANPNVPNDYANEDDRENHQCDEGDQGVDPEAVDPEDQVVLTGRECSPQELAQYDLDRWLTDIAGELPNGTGTIEVEGLDDRGARYTIQVSWNEPNEPAPLSYTLQTTISFLVNTASDAVAEGEGEGEGGGDGSGDGAGV